MIYITVLGRTDFEHRIFSIISSQSCFIEMDLFIKSVYFVETRKKLNIFKIGEQFHQGSLPKDNTSDVYPYSYGSFHSSSKIINPGIFHGIFINIFL